MSPTGLGTSVASADHWLGELAAAYDSPSTVAARWRAGGGRVVGVFGHCAPRELVSAAGMLPIPLDPSRLERAGNVPAGLTGELSEEALALLSALMAGRLDWLDALLIGRDSEAHTKLFYAIREMAGDPEFTPLIPPFAFSDVLRLPLRTSAVYNRIRLRQLAEVVSAWALGSAASAGGPAASASGPAAPAGGGLDSAALRAAVQADALTRRQLRALRDLQRGGVVTAWETLIAARGAQVLPSAEAQSALEQAVAGARAQQATPAEGPRIFVTGSEPRPDIYALLEAEGLRIIGDDHEWDIGELETPAATGDPIDWLADRYQFSPIGAARAGLDRVGWSAARVRELGVDALLQLTLPGDEASGWELPDLRARLEGVPVISVELDRGPRDQALREAAASLRERLGQAAGPGQPTTPVTRG